MAASEAGLGAHPFGWLSLSHILSYGEFYFKVPTPSTQKLPGIDQICQNFPKVQIIYDGLLSSKA